MKKLYLILFLLVSICAESQIQILDQLRIAQIPVAGGTPPVYEDATWFAQRTSSPSISYMATVNEDDILILNATVDHGSVTISVVPSGWTEIFNQTNNLTGNNYIYWKRADGTEGGTSDNWTLSALPSNFVAHMFRFSGCVTTGNPYENIVSTPMLNTTGQTLSNGLALGDNRLGVMMYAQSDNTTLTDNNVGYVQQEYDSTDITGDYSQAMATQDIPTSSFVDGTAEWTTGNNEYHMLSGLFLK